MCVYSPQFPLGGLQLALETECAEGKQPAVATPGGADLYFM